MKANYNPFSKEWFIETEHGIINNENRRYFTHRKRPHIFKKYQAFGISLSEVEICYREHVDHVVIKYHGTKENTLYRIPMKHLVYMERYDNNGDTQILIPINQMTVIGKEELGNTK